MNVKSDDLLHCTFRPMGLRYYQMPVLLYLKNIVKNRIITSLGSKKFYGIL